MNFAIASRFFLVFVVFVLIGSCAIGRRPSFPSFMSDSDWKRSSWCFWQGCVDPVPVLSNKDIELALRSHNDENGNLGTDYFAVTFLIRSKLALAMDPTRIQLITSKADRITPHGFIMRIPWPELSERNRCMMTHYVSRGNITAYPTYNRVTGALYRITPDACYDLFFSIHPPKRGEGFYLDFQGLFSETGPYPIPLIQFD